MHIFVITLFYWEIFTLLFHVMGLGPHLSLHFFCSVNNLPVPAPFFSLHLDGLKTPIYFILFPRIDGGIQKKVKKPQPKPPLYPSPQTHPQKNLKI
jgi:hypothetical protein